MPPGAGRRHMAPPPIAKAKAMPQGCGSICPASDALCIAGFKQASACQPPTREICALDQGLWIAEKRKCI